MIQQEKNSTTVRDTWPGEFQVWVKELKQPLGYTGYTGSMPSEHTVCP